MTWQIPVKTGWMKTQESHFPSMEYAKDIHRVASRLKNFTALEVGAAWGLSTLAILEAGAKHLTSVDPNTQIEAPNEVEANGYKEKYAWNCVRSDRFWQENKDSFDLIYIDGSHIYEDVRNDLYQAWRFLNRGGLLLADDWDHRKNVENDPDNSKNEYGVSLACWEFWRDHPCKAGIEGRVLWFKKP